MNKLDRQEIIVTPEITNNLSPRKRKSQTKWPNPGKVDTIPNNSFQSSTNDVYRKNTKIHLTRSMDLLKSTKLNTSSLDTKANSNSPRPKSWRTRGDYDGNLDSSASSKRKGHINSYSPLRFQFDAMKIRKRRDSSDISSESRHSHVEEEEDNINEEETTIPEMNTHTPTHIDYSEDNNDKNSEDLNEEDDTDKSIIEKAVGLCIDSSSENKLQDYYSDESKSDSEEKKKKGISMEDFEDFLVQMKNIKTINHQDISFKNKIGEGAFSVVWKAIHNFDHVAVKVLKKNNFGKSLVSLQNEINSLNLCTTNPHVLQLVGVCFKPYLCIVTELMECSLYNLLHVQNVKLSFSKSVHFATCIAEGLKIMHSNKPPLIHRDLSSENILYKNGKIKISDLGISQQTKGKKKNIYPSHIFTFIKKNQLTFL